MADDAVEPPLDGVSIVTFKWFKSGKKKPLPATEADQEAIQLDGLILQERWEDAVERLQAQLKKNRDDLHAHLRLAEAYIGLKKLDDALLEYKFVADSYARDGFYDKAIALLSKAARLAPMEEDLKVKVEALRMAKRQEHKREAAMEGLRRGGAEGQSWALQVQRGWHRLARGPLVERLGEDSLRSLFGSLVLSRWEEGTQLAQAGERDQQLYLVLSGVVEARLPRDEGASGTGLRTFGPGDVIGESVLLGKKVWPADYWTVERTALLTLTRLGLEQALVGNPDPKGMLDALRWQAHDQVVAKTVARLAST